MHIGRLNITLDAALKKEFGEEFSRRLGFKKGNLQSSNRRGYQEMDKGRKVVKAEYSTKLDRFKKHNII